MNSVQFERPATNFGSASGSVSVCCWGLPADTYGEDRSPQQRGIHPRLAKPSMLDRQAETRGAIRHRGSPKHWG